MLAIIYIPPLQKIFGTAPLETWQWWVLIICPPLILVADEIRKRVVGRGGDSPVETLRERDRIAIANK